MKGNKNTETEKTYTLRSFSKEFFKNPSNKKLSANDLHRLFLDFEKLGKIKCIGLTVELNRQKIYVSNIQTWEELKMLIGH